MGLLRFVGVATELEEAGLLWQPEIGDEVSHRQDLDQVSILVDPQGLTPSELRSCYIWLPTVEQMVSQCEARQAILFHAGLELTDQSICYKAVLRAPFGSIETSGQSLRFAIGQALRDLLVVEHSSGQFH